MQNAPPPVGRATPPRLVVPALMIACSIWLEKLVAPCHTGSRFVGDSSGGRGGRAAQKRRAGSVPRAALAAAAGSFPLRPGNHFVYVTSNINEIEMLISLEKISRQSLWLNLVIYW